MNNQNYTCKKCNGKGKPSKALNNTLIGFDDFGGDVGDRGTTMSRVGPAKMVDCIKCENCGHSWVPLSTRELAMKWWNSLDKNTQIHLAKEYEVSSQRPFSIQHVGLTSREIEAIWNKEKILV